MMMPKSETMALMMALSPAAIALTMAMMQLPMVRKMDWIWQVLLVYVAEQEQGLVEDIRMIQRRPCLRCCEGIDLGVV
jgi:hypothetical protein